MRSPDAPASRRRPPTHLGSVAANVAESGWLVALVVVPLLFNLQSERIFEGDKILLMRSIALLVFAALLVWLGERGREALSVEGRPAWTRPAVRPALLLGAVYVLSTGLSVAPRLSLWGSYLRVQGTYTWLSYLAFFVAVVLLVREWRQVERIVSVVLLTSAPICLYAWLQRGGLDPVPWGGDVVHRVSSTAGNPGFLAAYLVLVVPLTLTRVIEHCRRLGRSPRSGEKRERPGAALLLAGAYVLLLTLQIATVLYSRSRGPLLGLLAALVFFGLLAATGRRHRIALAVTGAAVAGLGLVAAAVLSWAPPEVAGEDGARTGPLPQLVAPDRGTARVRLLVWEGTTELLADDPGRAVVGHGPETMYLAFHRHYPPELGRIEAREAAPDRAHNETLDSLVTTGLLGLLAETALFLSIFYHALRSLGRVGSPRRRALFAGAVGGGALLGALLPYLIEGSLRMAGVGLPVGIAAGLSLFAIGTAPTETIQRRRRHGRGRLLLVALVAAVLGHYLEIQVGIAVAATRLHFWLYAGLIAAVGIFLADGGRGAEGRVEAGASAPDRGPGGTRRSLGVMTGLALAVLTYDFYAPSLGLTPSAAGSRLLWIFLGTWLFGAVLRIDAEGGKGPDDPSWPARMGRWALISLGTWLLFSLLHVPWASPATPSSGTLSADALRGYASHAANGIALVYLLTAAVVAALAGFSLRQDGASGPFPARPPWRLGLYGVLIASIPPLVVAWNLNGSRADAFARQARVYEESGAWDAARILYEEALGLRPRQDAYLTGLGRALMGEAADMGGHAPGRGVPMGRARAVLERARRTTPLDPDHPRNLAKLHRSWATLVEEDAERDRHRALAEGYYAEAARLAPNDVTLWNEWAAVQMERGRLERARETLRRSARLDDRFAPTFVLLGELEARRGRPGAALDHYERALDLAPPEDAAALELRIRRLRSRDPRGAAGYGLPRRPVLTASRSMSSPGAGARPRIRPGPTSPPARPPTRAGRRR